MIEIIMEGYEFNYDYDVKELLKLFYASDQILMDKQQATFDSFHEHEARLISRMHRVDNQVIVETLYQKGQLHTSFVETGKWEPGNQLSQKKTEKRLMKRGMFILIKAQRGGNVSWGILTGIRPTKIVHDLMKQKIASAEILRTLQEDYLIDGDKAQLLLQVAKTEYDYLYPLDPQKISLYISIPFCPTRCVYCSFPSNALPQWGHLQQQYVDTLCHEIKQTAIKVNETGKQIETLYIGGGTPSVLTVPQLKQLNGCLRQAFSLDQMKEFTFEAGRPDTITKEKLAQWKAMGVTRISINPQTMNDCTLQAIGRSHSTEELIEAYGLAKEMGFENINMDIILGLPGETSAMVVHTMKELKALAPANLTVHTLALKNTSRLKEAPEEFLLAEGKEVIRMLEITQKVAVEMGLNPYYLYRQKHMLGNLENVGYAKPGYEGIYNIKIMEEKQTILAFGAGGISKFVFPAENRLERCPNVKNLEHYLNRVDEMVKRKTDFLCNR